MMAVKKLAWLSAGLLVALFAFGLVPAAQGAVLPAAQSDSGLKVQDRSHDNDNPDNTTTILITRCTHSIRPSTPARPRFP